MRVNIDEIKEGGLERAWDLPRETVDEMVQGDPAAYRARAPLHVDARLRKVERRVLFDARGEAALTAPCGRCLTPVELEVPLEFELTYVPADEAEEEAATGEQGGDHAATRVAGSFAAESADEETYSGKVIDLDPAVREQLLLALPRYPVCQESCKGLCSVCGANLNERDCGCDRHVPDPRWAGLEKLKKK
ncbi:hypothetical protein AMYX_09040 [Anaeromyxobacter diazotrophicus]|uniref:DUF177 domain-containing protein n=2 Tax=Anaeromyxobacter diazotrophicus TaxID=2590199 RepID=A0A7I9VIJ7_9BACT|nr:hypothetical protein AMYX_09040 [Anaeromyxobacter diazotrophicus]